MAHATRSSLIERNGKSTSGVWPNVISCLLLAMQLHQTLAGLVQSPTNPEAGRMYDMYDWQRANNRAQGQQQMQDPRYDPRMYDNRAGQQPWQAQGGSPAYEPRRQPAMYDAPMPRPQQADPRLHGTNQPPSYQPEPRVYSNNDYPPSYQMPQDPMSYQADASRQQAFQQAAGHRPSFSDRLGSAASRLLSDLRVQDTCQAVYQSKAFGYETIEYKVVTKDHYEITIHRLVHPSDLARGGPPKPGAKKPYLLLHGLIGSSSSWLRNVEANHQPAAEPLDLTKWIRDSLMESRPQGRPAHTSTADYFAATHSNDQSRTWEGVSHQQLLKNKLPQVFGPQMRPVAGRQQEIYMAEDKLPLGPEFQSANRYFELPRTSKPYISNSLAFTLSNFGYDVWLLNLRGNKYANKHRNSFSPNMAEFWDFDGDNLVREDLLAMINFVRREVNSQQYGPMGMVAYSYGCLHMLGLLAQYPEYQSHLRPVVMMAPTLFAGAGGGNKRRFLLSLASKVLPRNGPFPLVGHGAQESMIGNLCKIPLASKLCHLLEMLLHGQGTSVKQFIYDHKQSLLDQDVACGGTSQGVLKQVIENLGSVNIHPKYQPFVGAVQTRRQPIRSVMLIHSASDETASMTEVARIRDEALKTLTIADYVIEESPFNHIDFLFSQRNQYLVNGEIIRMVSLYDYLQNKAPIVNKPPQAK